MGTATGRPILAICRGLQIVNVALGGSLIPHLPQPHRHRLSELALATGSRVAAAAGTTSVTISCFHQQALDRLGHGLRASAWSDDGIVEAVERDADAPRFLGLQWHPEDTADRDAAQQAIFAAFVAAARH